MRYMYSESAFIIMPTEQGLFLWTPWSSGAHVFKLITDDMLWWLGFGVL